jgi:ArsR family metal-binding transcriptional regulator
MIFTDTDYDTITSLLVLLTDIKTLRQYTLKTDAKNKELQSVMAELAEKEVEIIDKLRPLLNKIDNAMCESVISESFIDLCKEIWKELPQDDCGECGCSNCYMFAMKIASGQLDINCPYYM